MLQCVAALSTVVPRPPLCPPLVLQCAAVCFAMRGAAWCSMVQCGAGTTSAFAPSFGAAFGAVLATLCGAGAAPAKPASSCRV